MVFLQPIWFVLAVPLALAFVARRPPTRALSVFRAVLYGLIVLTLADPAVRRPAPGGAVIVVADRSASMPAGSEAAHLEALRTLGASRGADDLLGLVSFGARTQVETPASKGAPPAGFAAEVDASASSLAEAIDAALSIAPGDMPTRILILSDGRSTDGDARAQAALAASRGVAIDHRFVGRTRAADVAIERIEAPLRVAPGESFLIDAWVASPSGGPTEYTLQRSGQVIARGTADLPAGGGRLTFRDTAQPGATLDYTLTLTPNEDDTLPENNRARLLVGVQDTRAVLVVTETPGGGLANLLKASGLNVDARSPVAVDWSAASLAGYAAVVLENVAIQDIGLLGAQMLSSLVEDRGLGLVMTGGKRSFAAGGYLGTPIERVLPVSLELRQERRLLAASIVVTLDRSGSMAAPVASGQTKMRLAGEASAQVYEMMTPIDRFGAIAVDSSPATVAKLEPIGTSPGVPSALRRIQAGGGGIFVYTALTAAAAMLTGDDAPGARHIVLFADAADAEEPGDYINLLSKLRDAGVTVSVVALGTRADADAALLDDIARRGEGRALYTNDARILPQLFAQDALAVVRGAFLDQPTPVDTMAGLYALVNADLGPFPSIGGYNPTYAKDGATVGAVTVDEYAAPVVASWEAGLGRVAVYTGEVDGQWTGDFAAWSRAGSLIASLVRHAAGSSGSAGEDVVIRQRLEPGALRIDVYTDRAESMERPEVRTLRVVGEQTRAEQRAMSLTASDRLTLTVPLGGRETVVPAVRLDGETIPLTPAVLPYSPEHRPETGVASAGGLASDGERVLARLSERTGGRERVTLASMWEEMPASVRLTELRPWLAALAVVVLLLEVAERRLGVLGVAGAGAARVRKARPQKAGAKRAEVPVRTVASQPGATKPASVKAREEGPGPTGSSGSGVLGALGDVRGERRG